jgi:glutamate synthase domain-containing protein 2
MCQCIYASNFFIPNTASFIAVQQEKQQQACVVGCLNPWNILQYICKEQNFMGSDHVQHINIMLVMRQCIYASNFFIPNTASFIAVQQEKQQ